MSTTYNTSTAVEGKYGGSHQQRFLGTIIGLFVPTVVFVGLRCYTRLRIQGFFKVDDYLLVLSLLFYAVIIGMLITAVKSGGLGRSYLNTPMATLVLGLKLQFVVQIVYYVATFLLRLSVALFQMRIASVKPIYRRIYTFSIVVNCANSLLTMNFGLVRCIPFEKVFNPGVPGQCLSWLTVKNLILASSVLSMGLDFLYTVLPIMLLWGLKLPKHIKLSVSLLLALGLIAGSAVFVRFHYIIKSQFNKLDFDALAQVSTWSVIELSAGSIAASVVTLRPLLNVVFQGKNTNGRPVAVASHSPHSTMGPDSASSPNLPARRRLSSIATTVTSHLGQSIRRMSAHSFTGTQNRQRRRSSTFSTHLHNHHHQQQQQQQPTTTHDLESGLRRPDPAILCNPALVIHNNKSHVHPDMIRHVTVANTQRYQRHHADDCLLIPTPVVELSDYDLGSEGDYDEEVEKKRGSRAAGCRNGSLTTTTEEEEDEKGWSRQKERAGSGSSTTEVETLRDH